MGRADPLNSATARARIGPPYEPALACLWGELTRVLLVAR